MSDTGQSEPTDPEGGGEVASHEEVVATEGLGALDLDQDGQAMEQSEPGSSGNLAADSAETEPPLLKDMAASGDEPGDVSVTLEGGQVFANRINHYQPGFPVYDGLDCPPDLVTPWRFLSPEAQHLLGGSKNYIPERHDARYRAFMKTMKLVRARMRRDISFLHFRTMYGDIWRALPAPERPLMAAWANQAHLVANFEVASMLTSNPPPPPAVVVPGINIANLVEPGLIPPPRPIPPLPEGTGPRTPMPSDEEMETGDRAGKSWAVLAEEDEAAENSARPDKGKKPKSGPSRAKGASKVSDPEESSETETESRGRSRTRRGAARLEDSDPSMAGLSRKEQQAIKLLREMLAKEPDFDAPSDHLEELAQRWDLAPGDTWGGVNSAEYLDLGRRAVDHEKWREAILTVHPRGKPRRERAADPEDLSYALHQTARSAMQSLVDRELGLGKHEGRSDRFRAYTGLLVRVEGSFPIVQWNKQDTSHWLMDLLDEGYDLPCCYKFKTDVKIKCPFKNCKLGNQRLRSDLNEHLMQSHLGDMSTQCAKCPQVFPSHPAGKLAYIGHLALRHRLGMEVVNRIAEQCDKKWPLDGEKQREDLDAGVAPPPNPPRIGVWVRSMYLELAIRQILESADNMTLLRKHMAAHIKSITGETHVTDVDGFQHGSLKRKADRAVSAEPPQQKKKAQPAPKPAAGGKKSNKKASAKQTPA